MAKHYFFWDVHSNHLLIFLIQAHFQNLKTKRFSVNDSAENCLERLIFSLRVTPCTFSARCVSNPPGSQPHGSQCEDPFPAEHDTHNSSKDTLPSPAACLTAAGFFHLIPGPESLQRQLSIRSLSIVAYVSVRH